MTWKKVVRVTAVSACPKCGNPAFDPEPGSDLDDPHALVKCGKCGWIGPVDKFVKPVERR
jgi:predicted nucleic-acid-binding Zn-ribbon protein